MVRLLAVTLSVADNEVVVIVVAATLDAVTLDEASDEPTLNGKPLDVSDPVKFIFVAEMLLEVIYVQFKLEESKESVVTEVVDRLDG